MLPIRLDKPDWHGWHWISALMEGCERKFWLGRVVGAELMPGLQSPDGMDLGWLSHIGTAEWLGGTSGWEPALLNAFRLRPGISQKVFEHAHKICSLYEQYWRVRPAPKVLATEYETGPRNGAAGLGAIYDHIVMQDDRVCIMEKKFEARKIWEMKNYWSRNGQILLQALTWGEKEVASFGELAGVILDLTDTRGSGDHDRVVIELDEIRQAFAWFRKSLRLAVNRVEQIEELHKKGQDQYIGARPVCRTGRYGCPFEKACFGGAEGARLYTLPDGRSLADVFSLEKEEQSLEKRRIK